jgi:two-component system, LuxR family, sensor kinase FixL
MDSAPSPTPSAAPSPDPAWGPLVGVGLGPELFDALPDAVLVVDRRGIILLANSEAATLFGYSREEIQGSSVEALVPRAERGHHARLRSAYHEEPRSRPMGAGLPTSGLRRDGTVIPLDIKLTPVRTPQGECVLAVARDMSMRAARESSLREANVELAESNRALEHFAYVASHDLQEPLRKIVAFGDRLATRYSDRLDEQGRDYLARMQRAAGRMSHLIDDLLTYSRVTTRKEEPESVALEPLLEEVVQDLEATRERVGGTIEVRGPFPPVRGRPVLLRQLMQNLLANALKFSRDDEPSRVQVEGSVVRLVPEGGTVSRPWLELRVADNGIGFEPQYARRIFGIFERLHSRDRYDGTGVGLAICARIAELHGGAIRAEGVPGEGATFVVTLPVDDRSLEDTP